MCWTSFFFLFFSPPEMIKSNGNRILYHRKEWASSDRCCFFLLQCAPVGSSAKRAPSRVCAPTTAPATPSMARASVSPAGSATAAPNVSRRHLLTAARSPASLTLEQSNSRTKQSSCFPLKAWLFTFDSLHLYSNSCTFYSIYWKKKTCLLLLCVQVSKRYNFC